MCSKNYTSIIILIYALIFSSSLAQASAHFSKNHLVFVPPIGKTLLLIGQDMDTIDQYIQKTNNIPNGVMFYTSVQRMEGLLSAIDIGAGIQHGNAILSKYPNATIQIGLYMVDALEAINAGQYDQNLNILADWLLKANRPVFLRIGYEFDNPENHYEPVLYKKSFRHIVDLLRKKGVHNTAYVWHSYTAAKQLYSWNDWYPGDNYVDWLGASIFSTGNIPFAEKFIALSKKHHKAFMIAESSPMGMYTVHGKKDWFNHVFRFIIKNNIQAFCYINSNWDVLPMYKGQHWGDARIEKYPEIQKLWSAEINKKRYMRSSADLFKEIGWEVK